MNFIHSFVHCHARLLLCSVNEILYKSVFEMRNDVSTSNFFFISNTGYFSFSFHQVWNLLVKNGLYYPV